MRRKVKDMSREQQKAVFAKLKDGLFGRRAKRIGGTEKPVVDKGRAQLVKAREIDGRSRAKGRYREIKPKWRKDVKNLAGDLNKIETEVRREIEKIFDEKKKKLGVEAGLDLEFLDHTPIVDKNVYGEAFPERKRATLDVFAPDATTEEIESIVCEELVHIKHPELRHGPEFWKKVRECK